MNHQNGNFDNPKQSRARKSLAHKLALRALKFFDVILVTLPFAFVWLYYYAPRIVMPYYDLGNYIVILLFILLYTVFGRVYDAFLISINRISEIVFSQVLAELVANFFMYIVLCLLTRHLPNALPLLFSLMAQAALSALWAYSAHKLYYRKYRAQKTLIVYDRITDMKENLEHYGLEKKFDVVENLSISVPMEEILASVDGVETVFLCGLHSHDRNRLLKYCVDHGKKVYLNPRIGDTIFQSSKPVYLCNLPIFRIERGNHTPEYLFVKRAFDLLVSGIAIVILSPVMLVTAVAIKSYDGGPVLYKQVRLTKDGKEFEIWKFRSMIVNAEKDGVARLSSGNKDNRITPVGRFIRKCRIDELPQLFNILMGQMSIVGPRPERPSISKQYEEILPEFRLRLQAKAGLTGLAQIYGKYNTTPYDKLQFDLMYIASASVLEDLRIMFATVKILFMPESTEGIDEGQTTAMSKKKS